MHIPPKASNLPDPAATPPLGDPDATTGPASLASGAGAWLQSTPAKPNGEIGDYELLGEIAHGGMGVVYRARQVSLNRPVALKMIRRGELASAANVARFRGEAEAAANLDHPNILPIYEVGQHDGQPFFSMKLVEGGNLNGRVSDLVSDPRSAARLLALVARAVHFAHQRGILHRDLKPANVLLDCDGTPYVTDFGLAKRVEGDSGLTQSGAIVGTPSYMAPEQARAQKQLSTAADVYSLGACLYELLTGRPPFRADSVMNTVLQVIEREPEHPQALNPSADHDLSVIAMKCLEKEPGRRYGSAEALADEVERWLRDEPITARPASPAERAWRWARRNRAIASLGVAVLLLLLGTSFGSALVALHIIGVNRDLADAKQAAEEQTGLARTESEDAKRARADEERHRKEADENYREARRAVGDYLTRIAADTRLARPALKPLRKELLEKAIPYFERFIRLHHQDPGLQAEVADAYFRIAEITALIGSQEKALGLYREYQRIQEDHIAAHADDADARRHLAICLQNQALILVKSEQNAAALAAAARAAELIESAVRDRPESLSFQVDRAQIASTRAILLTHCYRPEEAVLFLQAAIDTYRDLARREPDNPVYQSGLGATLNNLADAYMQLNRQTESRDALREAIEHQQRAVAKEPTNITYQQFLANHLYNVGIIEKQMGKRVAALTAFREALPVYERLVQGDPDWNQAQESLSRAYLETAQLEDDPAEGLRRLEQARANLERLSAVNPTQGGLRSRLAEILNLIGKRHAGAGRLADALLAMERSRDLAAEQAKSDPLNRDAHQSNQARCQMYIGYLLTEAKRHKDAQRALRESAELYEKLVAAHPQNAEFQTNLGKTYGYLGLSLREVGERDLAEKAFRQSAEIQTRQVKDNPEDLDAVVELAGTHCNLGHAIAVGADPAQAIPAYEEAVRRLEGVLRAQAGHATARLFLLNSFSGCVSVLDKLRRYEEGIRMCDRAIKLAEGPRLKGFQLIRVSMLARTDRYEAAVKEAREMADRPATNPDTHYNAACVVALAAATAAADTRLPATKRAAQAEEYGSAAVAMLRKAVGAGFKDAALMKKDGDLESLRGREEFKKLLADLEKSANSGK